MGLRGGHGPNAVQHAQRGEHLGRQGAVELGEGGLFHLRRRDIGLRRRLGRGRDRCTGQKNGGAGDGMRRRRRVQVASPVQAAQVRVYVRIAAEDSLCLGWLTCSLAARAR